MQSILRLYPQLVYECTHGRPTNQPLPLSRYVVCGIMFGIYYYHGDSSFKNPHGLNQDQIRNMTDVILNALLEFQNNNINNNNNNIINGNNNNTSNLSLEYAYCISQKGINDILPNIIAAVFGKDSKELKAFLDKI